jgi:hypothetical protein
VTEKKSYEFADRAKIQANSMRELNPRLHSIIEALIRLTMLDKWGLYGFLGVIYSGTSASVIGVFCMDYLVLLLDVWSCLESFLDFAVESVLFSPRFETNQLQCGVMRFIVCCSARMKV